MISLTCVASHFNIFSNLSLLLSFATFILIATPVPAIQFSSPISVYTDLASLYVRSLFLGHGDDDISVKS